MRNWNDPSINWLDPKIIDEWEFGEEGFCADCLCKRGEKHKLGCDWERCKIHGHQAVSCSECYEDHQKRVKEVEWIPLSESRPPMMVDVLLFNGKVQAGWNEAQLDEDVSFCGFDPYIFDIEKVTHWAFYPNGPDI